MNILLTSAGRRSYLVKYFKEALKGEGLVHASNSVWSPALQIADKTVITPLIYDSLYIDFLLKYSLKNKISAIIPLFNIDLPILSKSIKKFSQKKIKVIVADYETTLICNDKWKTFKFLKSIGINTPDSCLSLKVSKQKLKNREWNYPLIIKPRWGMGSIGIYQVNNDLELKVLYEKTRNQIFSSYLKYESSSNPEKCVIIQKKLEGNEYGLDIFNDLKEKFLTCIPKRKIAMRAGETDSAEIINDPELFKIGKKISQSLRFVANLDVDCVKTKKDYNVIDLNCRFGGQYPFSHLAGVNFPKAIISMLKGKPVKKSFLIAKPGTIGIKDIIPIKLNRD